MSKMSELHATYDDRREIAGDLAMVMHVFKLELEQAKDGSVPIEKLTKFHTAMHAIHQQLYYGRSVYRSPGDPNFEGGDQFELHNQMMAIERVKEGHCLTCNDHRVVGGFVNAESG